MMMGMANMGGRMLVSDSDNMLTFLEEVLCVLGKSGTRLIEEEKESDLEENVSRLKEEDVIGRAYR